MWNWINNINLASSLAEEIIENETDELARRMQRLSRQYQKEIALAGEELQRRIFTWAAETSVNEKTMSLFAQGAKELVLYALYQVLREQGGQPTQEQNHMLELYCAQLQLPYNEMDFLLAVNCANGLREHLETLLALPQGKFWQAVLAELQGRAEAETVLDSWVQLYGDVVMRFSLLAGPDSEAPMVIMGQMVDRLNEWLVNNGGTEAVEPADYVQAYRDMAKAYGQVAEASHAEEDGLPVWDLYALFVLGLAQVLLQGAKLSFADKTAVLDGLVRSCEIPAALSGHEILNSVLAKDEIGGTMEMMSSFGPEHGNLWQIEQAMAIKCGQIEQATAFLEASSRFLVGLESALLTEYPSCLKKGQAAAFMLEVAEALNA